MTKDATCECGHSWAYHFGFLDSKRKDKVRDTSKQPCEHWGGCECKDWKVKEDEHQI